MRKLCGDDGLQKKLNFQPTKTATPSFQDEEYSLLDNQTVH